ncbi:MAG: phosphotransferase, partial [Candidatus Staskawiczbacteria bacterium]|nr:phosphotransferase [Candidatus Staskawiczbacteria bacterium]
EERGVRVSQIMQTLDGKLFAEFNNDLFAVFSFVEANYFWPDYDLLISAAKEIAKMHLGFNSLDDDDFKKIENFSGQGKGYFNVIKDYDREDFIKLKDLIKSKTEQNDTDKLVLGKIDIFLETCDKIKNYLERLEKLPKQIIHSDLHPHNILVNDKEVKVLIDFDSMRISQQARDVAFVIYRLGKQFFVNKDLKEVQENAPKLKDLFVKEYCLVKELTEEENKLLPVLVKDEFLRKLLFVLKGVYQDNNFAWAKDLSSFVASFEEIDYFWPEFKI